MQVVLKLSDGKPILNCFLFYPFNLVDSPSIILFKRSIPSIFFIIIYSVN